MKQRTWKVPFVYLKQQFANPRPFFKEMKKVIVEGDFTLGRKLAEFEDHVASKFKVKHVIGVANGTDALFLVLKALGIGPGDEVITAPNSFVASASCSALVGAKPTFCDVRDDYTLDPQKLENAITKRTKAVIPVHLSGIMADMAPINRIAKKHNLFVIEDAAQAAGAQYNGKFSGTLGIAGCFSFHPLKILNILGDGGMITTNDDKLATSLRLWRNHGLRTRDDVVFFAYNSRMDTLQAAVADVVLKDIDRVVRLRRKHAALYDKLLGALEPEVHIPKRDLSEKPTVHTYTQYVIQAKRRNALQTYLNSKGIETKVHYPVPLHLQEAAKYLGYKKGDFPVTEKQADTILSIPDHQYLNESQIRYVVDCIKEFYKK